MLNLWGMINWLRPSWCDYGCSEFTTIVVWMLMLFAKGCYHLTVIVILTTTVLDILQSWSSDKVFKSSGKSTIFYYFHSIERLYFCKTKLTSKREFYQENACKRHKNSHKISLQKWLSIITLFIIMRKEKDWQIPQNNKTNNPKHNGVT